MLAEHDETIRIISTRRQRGRNAEIMKKDGIEDPDEILPGYDFSHARPNKYASRYAAGSGSEFEVAAVRPKASPLDVVGVDLGLSAEEIVSAIRETRARDSR